MVKQLINLAQQPTIRIPSRRPRRTTKYGTEVPTEFPTPAALTISIALRDWSIQGIRKTMITLPSSLTSHHQVTSPPRLEPGFPVEDFPSLPTQQFKYDYVAAFEEEEIQQYLRRLNNIFSLSLDGTYTLGKQMDQLKRGDVYLCHLKTKPWTFDPNNGETGHWLCLEHR